MNVLLVDDDPSAALIFRLLIERAGYNVRLQVAEGGQEAIDYLAGEAPFSDRASHPVPDLVVLDLIMPEVSGFDVLDWLRRSPNLRSVPVVVFTGSLREKDKEDALAKGATRFISKPTDFPSLKSAIAEILDLAAHWPGNP